MNPPSNRLYFLDWVRILAFLLLVLYHVGMYYVTWDWHVKSPHAGSAIEPLMMLSSPWRLGLLFMISGAASSFMLSKMAPGRFMRQRSFRLLVPLLFGMLVIVPPQPYFEAIEKLAYAGSYADFMKLYVHGYQGFCRADGCLDLPTWNHLWFVAYLWVYTLLAGALLMVLRERFDKLAQVVVGPLSGWKLIVLPAAVLALARITLLPHFPVTNGLVDDWYNHAQYVTLFVLGAMFARQAGVWPRMQALRWWALGVALACWGSFTVFYALPESMAENHAIVALYPAMRVVYALCSWCAIVAVCGFAHRHLNRDHESRRYLTDAVFPVYIAHQTLIVVMAHAMKPAGLHPAVEACMLVLLTLCLSFGLYEAVRRVRILRPLFGLANAAVVPSTDAKSPPQQSGGGLRA